MFINKNAFIKRKKKKNSIPTKKKALYAFLLFLCLIPSIWAINNIIETKSHGLSGTRCSVSLYDSENKLIVSDSSTLEFSSSRSVVSIFTKMIDGMKKVSADSVDLSRLSPPLSADVSISGTQKKYNFYFSLSDTCYCTDENGIIYAISENDAPLFLNSSYAASVYSTSVMPSLITANGEAVTPKSATWYYKNNAGTFLKSNFPSETTSDKKVYEMSGTLNFSFENNQLPDSCRIQVRQSDNLIFDGSWNNLSDIVIDIGSNLDVKILSVWNTGNDRQFHGLANYEFSVKVIDYADFYVNGNSVKQNGFLILRGSNIDNLSEIKFTADKNNPSAYPFSPIFQKIGNTAFCVLPFSDDMKIGTYNFNVAYSVFSKDISIELTEYTPTDIFNSQVPHEALGNLFDEDKQNEFQQLVDSITAPKPTAAFLYKNFARPSEFGYICEYTYDSEIASLNEEYIYSAGGNRYYSPDSDIAPVRVLNSGKIVYTGECDYLGKFVVVEHGLGLRTWYCNLSTINVLVGDHVARGEQLGRCGSHYTSLYNGFLILCSFDNVFIDINHCLYNDFEKSPNPSESLPN